MSLCIKGKFYAMAPFSQENGDPGPHTPGNMGTLGPHIGGSPFSHDTGNGAEDEQLPAKQHVHNGKKVLYG